MTRVHNQAHYHPSLDDPCAHEAPRWQETLPDWREENQTGLPDWLVILCMASFLLLCFAVIYGGIVLLGPAK